MRTTIDDLLSPYEEEVRKAKESLKEAESKLNAFKKAVLARVGGQSPAAPPAHRNRATPEEIQALKDFTVQYLRDHKGHQIPMRELVDAMRVRWPKQSIQTYRLYVKALVDDKRIIMAGEKKWTTYTYRS